MERKEIYTRLEELFETVIDEGKVTLNDNTTAKDVSGWDSLSHIQLIVAIEKHFDIKFTSDEILSWKNVGEIVDSISEKINK
ncbi:MAG: acyl carrier protein [Endomicrobiia bacterium]